MDLKQKATGLRNDVKKYWKSPPKGRYMPFREIAAYSGGGIGAYMIITIGTACILGTNNVLISSTLGVAPMDMYIMYVLAVVINIFLTGVRANIIDNTRNKAGKYRPYIVTMAIPTAIVAIAMVWFPYAEFGALFGEGEIFGATKAYIAKCAVIMVLNILLHFFYYFFYEAYDNLIHVLSPDSFERSDVAAIKSVVYSLAPSIINLVMPIIAGKVFKTNLTDIRVYRAVYPILAIGGILLCMIVYKYTEEKIVQARTHVVQIKFTDALRAVAKNKYFWIIALASWIGFLESAYANIMSWLYNYGGACSGTTFGLIQTLYGNASLWGMLAAPFCIRKWGKKAVLVVTNLFNIVCILAMLPMVEDVTSATMWLVFSALWLNALMGSFAHILNPAIQADIRDYQQYKTGERIDGMFSVVNTMGTVLALATSSVLPFIYEKNGITEENAKVVTSNPDVLNRVLGDGLTVREMLAQQAAEGQEVYSNAYSALYDLDILTSLLKVLIIVAAVGALMNVIPYFWYDFNERKQKSVVNVLKVRALFEDYGNGITNDAQLVEGIDVIRKARKMVNQEPKSEKKSDYKQYKNIADKQERKQTKKACKQAWKAAKTFNEDIEIAKFVCAELDKYSNPDYMAQLTSAKSLYANGLQGLLTMDMVEIKAELSMAKAMPKNDLYQKDARSAAIDTVNYKKVAYKEIKKNYSNGEDFIQPDFTILESYFEEEDKCDEKLKKLYEDLHIAKKKKKQDVVLAIKSEIKTIEAQRKEVRAKSKAETEKIASFNRAAKPYLDAEKMVVQAENYTHLDDIEAKYDAAKLRVEEADRKEQEESLKKEAAEKAAKALAANEKARKKAAKKKQSTSYTTIHSNARKSKKYKGKGKRK